MTEKSHRKIERLWDLEDKFTALAGSAIGTVSPVARQKKQENGSERANATRQINKTASNDIQADQAALAELCRKYWRPIFTFICSRGYSVPDAQDMTQDFFVAVFKRNLLSVEVAKRKGFRSVLLRVLRHFLAESQQKRHVSKHLGEVELIPWNDWLAEAPSHFSTGTGSFEHLPAEKLFDVRWAATVVEQALRRLCEECEIKGRRRMFNALSNHLIVQDVDYSNLAKALGVSAPTVKRVLHQLRDRYRILLRSEIAQTVDKPADVDKEIRYLCEALANIDERPDEPLWSRWLADHRRTLAIGMPTRRSVLAASRA